MLSIIVAVSKNGVIGKDGKLPWHIPTDMRNFKNLTQGHTVVMGRNTWESLPTNFRPLPNRTNLVLTSQLFLNFEGRASTEPATVRICNSLDEVKALSPPDEEVFIMGGAKVYQEAIEKNIAHTLYLTEVQVECSGDVRFPIIDNQGWRVVHKSEVIQNEGDEYPMIFYRLER